MIRPEKHTADLIPLDEARRLSGIRADRLRRLMKLGALTFADVHGSRFVSKRSLVEQLARDQAGAERFRRERAGRLHAPCRRCGVPGTMRARGLCSRCWYAPGVAQQFEPVNKCGRRGIGHAGTYKPLPEPTTAWPGTPEKLAVLIARAEAGVALWHPADPRYTFPHRPRD